MDDTSSDIAERVLQMFQEKSPIERLKMGFSMTDTSRHLVANANYENTHIYSAAGLRQELFLRFYGNDFDSATKQKILDHFGPVSTEQKDIKAAIVFPNENQYCFEHISKTEKGQKWWMRLSPLIQARLLRGKQESSKLLKVLSSVNGFHTWRNVKNLVEIVLANVKDGERILARAAEIKNSPDPDGIIDDMFGELRTVPYLLMKGFKNITYSRREELDFKAEFEGNVFNIESTYVHGPDFKTQEYMFNPKQESIPSMYKILPDKLIGLFERVYSKKKEQVMSHHGTPQDSLIFMITDLEETYAPWLEHAKVQGVHPILKFVLDCEIPVVVFGCGTVYEPRPDSLGGIFGILQAFKWQVLPTVI
jgi:hypothetical protein